jgi:hypothetical protein
VQHNGLRGKGVRVLHVFGDYLCHKWSRNQPLNEGFSLTRIRPTEPIPSEGKAKEVMEEEGEWGSEPLASPQGGIAQTASTQAMESELEAAEPVLTEGNDDAVMDALMDSVGVSGLDIGEDEGALCACDEDEEGVDDHNSDDHSDDSASDADAVSDAIAADGGIDPAQQLTPEEKRALIDGLLERCLLRAFHYVIKDKSLPVLVSSLWATLLK